MTVGTVFERSKVPLNKWLLATFLMASSKKGMSAHQLHRTLGVTYKTAWFMFHRIREAMRSGDLAPMGGDGGYVEADETFIGIEPGRKKAKKAWHHKMKVLSLVGRETGEARSIVVDNLTKREIMPSLEGNINSETVLITDEAGWYKRANQWFLGHESVDHSAGEYGRGTIHTNTIEGFFSIFKRGMKGAYQHCDKQHLHRYVAEFDFRYTNRATRGVDVTMRPPHPQGRRRQAPPIGGLTHGRVSGPSTAQCEGAVKSPTHTSSASASRTIPRTKTGMMPCTTPSCGQQVVNGGPERAHSISSPLAHRFPKSLRGWRRPLTLDARYSYRREDVVATLDRVCSEIGFPKTIRVDQASEFVSRDLDLWAYRR